ncbi:MAG TPA: DUF2490 domain-containing protein [Bacteroidales bacterium]|nr:DUF2490 domain-containing protein [Bacteroidales bacterium]HPS62710.1 DUF2490 domain-containing protein [Bacteroidales bacterium]
MIRKAAYFLAFLLAMAAGPLRSQVNDAQLWLNLSAEKKLTSHLSAEAGGELRLNENMAEAGTIYGEAGLSYRFLKKFRVGAFYRYTLKRRLDDTYKQHHGWYAEAGYRDKIGRIRLQARLRYQSRYNEPMTSDDAAIPNDHLRAKLTLKYNLKKSKFEPYISGEGFFDKRAPCYKKFDQLRLCAGIEYAFNRMHMIDLSYMFRREYQAKNPETDYVIGLGYHFTF